MLVSGRVVVIHPGQQCFSNKKELKKKTESITLQGTNISHLGKRTIIFKTSLGKDMLVPWRVKPGVQKNIPCKIHYKPFFFLDCP